MSTEKNRISWHPAFRAAAELELREDIEDLVFESEHPLSKEPLRIDLLILHLKNQDKVLHNEIGKIMRKHNIIEYKGPGDRLTIDTVYKILGYACLYKSFGTTVNEIRMQDITVSIFREAYPKELFQLLEQEKYMVEERYKGIFYVSGFPFPVQIVVFSLVDRKLHSAFRLLTKKIKPSAVKGFLLDTKGMRSKQDLDNINAILQVSYEANKEIYEQIRKEDLAMCEALRDLFKDELQEQYEAGMSQGISQGIERGISQGISQGISRRDITIIHNMQKNNFTMNQMMLATGKTESEIKKILETN